MDFCKSVKIKLTFEKKQVYNIVEIDAKISRVFSNLYINNIYHIFIKFIIIIKTKPVYCLI